MMNRADVARILTGIESLASPPDASLLSVFGRRAATVAAIPKANGVAQPVVAAMRFGRGRAVALGHPKYFREELLERGETQPFLKNLIAWAAATPEHPPRVGIWGDSAAARELRERGFAAKRADPERLEHIDVLLCGDRTVSDPELTAIHAFVRAGGGLIGVGQGADWALANPDGFLPEHYGPNRLFGPMGIVWTKREHWSWGKATFSVDGPPSPLTHVEQALEAARDVVAGRRRCRQQTAAQLGFSLILAHQSMPSAAGELKPALRGFLDGLEPPRVPTADEPVTLSDLEAYLGAAVHTLNAASLPPPLLTASPAAAAFPGAVPGDAPRLADQQCVIDCCIPRWHSTGLYAAPGECLTVHLPERVAGCGLRLRIGCHRDSNWHLDSWKRCSDITREFPLDQASTKAACAFGGPVYVVVPEDCKLGRVTLSITGAVAAPHYVIGETPLWRWRDELRQRPAPWAELVGREAVLSVRSQTIRHLDDPERVMRTWDRILSACAELAMHPPRRSPERFVCDVQISAGWMHAGYPIMCQVFQDEAMVDLSKLLHEFEPAWGFFHEAGHNHQSRDWTFAGTGEVTVNLFSLYVLDTVCGVSPAQYDRTSPEARGKLLGDFFAKPLTERGQKDPFTYLAMYVQLQEAFGWEAFRTVFAQYRALSPSAKPTTDAARRDQWLQRFSRTVGRNLGPFFTAWAVPTSREARDSLTDLPEWLPPDFPPEATG